jgi:type II secretory pathway component PulK
MKQLLGYVKNHNKGQALVSLLMFVVVAMTVISTTITTVITNTRAASVEEQSIDAYYVAESGAENALMRLLRDPNYTGETLAVGVNNAIITVTGSRITSIGNVNNLTKKIQVDVSYNDNQMIITSWKEIP